MEDVTKCAKCGGMMKKIGENTMKCEKCGNIVNSAENKDAPAGGDMK